MGESETPKAISLLDEAIDRLKESNTPPLGRNHAQALKAVIHAEMGNLEQALEDVEHAIPKEPELFKALYKVLIATRLKIQGDISGERVLTDTSYTDLFERVAALKLLPPTQDFTKYLEEVSKVKEMHLERVQTLLNEETTSSKPNEPKIN